MIRIHRLDESFEPPPVPFETLRLPMTAADRVRVRRRVTAPDGEEIALALPTGVKLWPGQVLATMPGKVYVVAAAPEEVLVIRPRNLREAAEAGHFIGNMHRDIDLQGEGIAALCDEALETRMERAGFTFTRERRPFLGGPVGEHSH